MYETLTLDNGQLSVVVAPELGASLVRFDALTPAGPVALMRPGGTGERDPNRLAMYPLVPWSNRIAEGGFEWRGRHYPLAANLPGEPLPIHGDGWQRPWQVEAQHESSQHEPELRLSLRSWQQPPFDYRAELTYRLDNAALEVTLTVTHLGEGAAPYGLGLHPWFPRTADVRLEAEAEGVWEVDADQLPTAWRRVSPGEPWDFACEAALPERRIDNLFTGWIGEARLCWPQRDISLSITANATRYLVFSPDAQADFFCFEPVSHAVNAHRFDESSGHGLVVLYTGQSHTLHCRFQGLVGNRSA
ncbi:aldose 1-epimerase [Billgrantia kenyensis]|uniref:Aldose 1-epimerase n=1 Tax=Billgrantia kenyensis TaxID=321266 RepID=A0A7V9W245_9GAMM|nr:aldose 1-epimerase [Halomonas kenyensis]MBA2779632.1 aldose 1-epimerase [Halomonas kenyensis]MCG6662344.1 aldose 1-epimerase [Halomonas kenyensis]